MQKIIKVLTFFILLIGISCTPSVTDDGGKNETEMETLSAPVIMPTGGSALSESDKVSIYCSPSDAAVYYTTDGTAPGAANGKKYTGSFAITSDTTVKAVAVKKGYKQSSICNADYTLVPSLYLNSLSVAGYNFTTAFSSDKYSYTTTIPNGAASVTLSWATDISGVTYILNNKSVTATTSTVTGLVVGNNSIELVVKKGNLEKTYNLTVKRQSTNVSSDCSLKTIKLTNKKDSGEMLLTSVSSSATLDCYTASASSDVDVVNLAVAANSDAASVVINDTDELNMDLILKEGSDNLFTVVVLAEDMVTTKTYSVKITRNGGSTFSVTSTTPTTSETGVATGAEITVNFSEAVSNTTGGTVTIQPAITLAKQWNGSVLTLSHGANFANNTKYTVTVSGFKNSSGLTMSDYLFSFTTGAASGFGVSSSTPANMTAEIELSSALEFTFPEAVANQSGGSVVITPSVALTKSWSGNKLIVSHGASFEYDTTYTVTVSGFKNGKSEVMKDYVVAFATIAKPAPEGRIYFKSTSGTPKIWLWEGTGTGAGTATGNRPICTLMGKTWPGPEMTSEGTHANWYYFQVDASLLPLAANCKIKFNGGTEEKAYDPTAKKPWYDGSAWYEKCPDGDQTPIITISPDGGTAKGEKIITVFIASDSAVTSRVAAFNGKSVAITSNTLSLKLSDYVSNNGTGKLTVGAMNTIGISSKSVEFTRDDSYVPPIIDVYGTTEKFAANAIYFLMTDRFVDGDSSNNHKEQGTFDIKHPNGGNIGYLGGDLKGIYDNADYISSMGFGSVWITPIVSNPDKPFDADGCDKNKTGYHGYWSDNFYKADEHWESSGFTFKEYTEKMRAKGIKTTLDIVGNHANPSYGMSDSLYNSSTYGKLYDKNGTKVADSGNKDRSSTSCTWFQGNDQLAQLADFKYDAPGFQDYLINAQMYWIEQGADAFRIDTIKHIPIAFWKIFSDRVRAKYPNFYMFGESFNGPYTPFQEKTNGSISVLDFDCMYAMKGNFANGGYSAILNYMHLDDGVYTNPYDLVTFYDNHDMARVNWDENTYVDAHNWLFTSRGIPCVYYGSEMAFKKGLAEHSGNRDYYGTDNIAKAKTGNIYKQLCKIGTVRKGNIALQNGLQINISTDSKTAVFLRVYQNKTDSKYQTALVMLNKGDAAVSLSASKYISDTDWVDAETGSAVSVTGGISASVPAHGFKVFITNAAATDAALIAKCKELMTLDRRGLTQR